MLLRLDPTSVGPPAIIRSHGYVGRRRAGVLAPSDTSPGRGPTSGFSGNSLAQSAGRRNRI